MENDTTGEQLKQFIERLEHLDAEKQDIADQMKEVRAEAKARGFDVKIINMIIARRKRDREQLEEEEALLQLYEGSL